MHVVEPTLEDYRGHCFALVRSFCDAAAALHPTLWSGKGAAQLAFGPGIEVRPFFSRRLRLFQLGALLARLLRGPDPVVVMTARRSDLTLVRLAARSTLPQGRLFLYFHWFRETPRRVAFLRRAARAQPEIGILATTESVAKIFEQAGFRRVLLLPYPLTAKAAGAASLPFRHLLYAGAARRDKGFDKIVDLIELLQKKGERLPVVVQATAEHYAKYNSATLSDIRRLEAIGYPALTMIRDPLSPQDYEALFDGAICLQPYDRVEFGDRVSGVTMDALVHGCPVIAPSGTWIAKAITPFSAGAVLDALDRDALFAAVEGVRQRYAEYQKGAFAAGMSLRARSWEPLLRVLP